MELNSRIDGNGSPLIAQVTDRGSLPGGFSNLVEDMVEAISDALADRVATKIGMAQTPLMGVDQLAAHLGVTKSWIYDRTRISESIGGIPHYKIGKYVRFDLEAVLPWLKATVK